MTIKLIKSILILTNNIAILNSLYIKLINRKSNNFIAINIYSLINKFYIMFFNRDNYLKSIIIIVTLFTITTIRLLLILILSIKY